MYRGSDSSPKEQFVYHNASGSGWGGSSYIDSVILRDRDDNSGWVNAADGTLEKRHYYCQNWRHDVVVMLSSGGRIAERDRYTPSGIPFGSPAGDTNFDGTINTTDQVLAGR